MTKMRIWLGVVASSGLLGCVTDFSPDPYKSSGYEATSRDAGARDARVDARVSTPDARVEEPASDDDAGSVMPSMPDADVAPTERGPCDLTGRWILTERSFSSAFGAKQVSQTWHYLEIAQQGDALTMTKTLLCGTATQGLVFVVQMDDSQAWPSYQRSTNYVGRTGTSKDNGGGCDVKLDEGVLVRGMTPDVYRDQSKALPTLEQEASGGTPGWEDWDGDGKPGITMNVSGAAQGRIYTAFRTYSTAAGSIEANARTFMLDYDWVSDRAVLSYDPPTAFVLASPAERAPDPGANLSEFTRLGDDQATGDDDSICAAIRELSATLTPNGNRIE